MGVVVHDRAGIAVRACGSLIDVHDAELARQQASEQATAEMQRLEVISGRIRLISLNAMIEASRFGTQGAAFSVVAQEIKSLGTEIGHLVGRIRGDGSVG